MIGVSEYSLQRIFMFITDLSLSEYIRKRRLSRAFEELKTSDIKIIDLSIKYQYESSISFSRAFIGQIMMILILPILFGINGLWLAATFSEIISLFVSLICLIKYKEKYN